MKLILTHKDWTHKEGTHARGYMYINDKFYEKEDLADLLSQSSKEDLIKILKEANGIFSFIIERDNLEMMATDGTRLYPIFYTTIKGTTYISDSAYDLPCEKWELSDMSLSEYNATAAVFAGGTLIEGIWQMKGGHWAEKSGSRVKQVPFSSYCVKADETRVKTAEEMVEILDHTFDRLLNSAKGRQLVIPLSDGYDSRLIACMLKKKGVENVLCFTVSREGTKELEQARSVAEKLGFDFVQADVTNTNPNYIDSEEFDRYQKHVGCLTNFVWLFEYFAVKQMKTQGLIDDNAIFIPGHSGDLLGGSLITKMHIRKKMTASKMASILLYDHFEYDYDGNLKDRVRTQLQEMIDNGATSYSALQNFIFQNKLAQQINNSARAYTFMGHEVRLPFWDKELLDFFRTTEYDQLYQKTFYNTTLNNHIFKPLGVEYADTSFLSEKAIIKQIIKHRIKRLIPKKLIYRESLFDDIVGEKELCKPMKEELTRKYGKGDCTYLSNNEIIKEWYLSKTAAKSIK